MPDLRDRPEFSVVISCYFEERSIAEFHARLSQALQAVGRSYEIIFVNDGSTDETLARLHEIFDADPNVACVIDLFRNAGQAAAITAGCTETCGDRIVWLDSDLQLDPEELPTLVAEFDKGYDVVSGYRTDRQDSVLRTAPSRVANWLLGSVSGAQLRDLGCTFKVLDARLVHAFEPGPFRPLRPASIIAAAGRCTEVPVAHHSRRYGRSGWTYTRLFSYFMDNLVSLSQRPFQILSGVCLFLGALMLLRALANLFFDIQILDQISNGLVLNVVVFSLLAVVGVSCAIGEYVIRSYLMLRRDPVYVVRSLRRRAP